LKERKRKGKREREKESELILLTLEEGTIRQGMQASLRIWKRQVNGFFLRASRRNAALLIP
jgi:hypothetical protein